MSNSLQTGALRLPVLAADLDPARLIRSCLRVAIRQVLQHGPARLDAAARAVWKYRHTFGRYPRLLAPQTFNEKVQFRKIFDFRRDFSIWVDKVAVRDWVAARSSGGVLPRLHHVTADPRDIPFDSLPDRFVVKASHGSGWVHVVRDKAALDRAALIAECEAWLARSYFEVNHEIVYRKVPRRIIVEEFLDNGAGEPAEDYKFYVFDGEVRFIQIDLARFGRHRRSLYDRDWHLLPVGLSVERHDAAVEPPAQLGRMIRLAEQLGAGYDFVRVDLYQSGGQVFFGELTPISGNGFNKFDPPQFDAELGACWTLRRWPLLRRPRPLLPARCGTAAPAPG